MDCIAEWGQSNLGSLEAARAQVEITYNAGWRYAKWQLFDPERLAGPTAVRYWDGKLGGSRSQRETFVANQMLQPAEWYDLFYFAKSNRVYPLVTPFDLEAVDLLEDLGVSAYKIASADITYTRLLEKIANTEKPVFLSTGAATSNEIDDAVHILRQAPLTVLACTLAYPTSDQHANLGRIHWLRSRYRWCDVGYSDHTIGTWAAYGSGLLGAKVLEKHVTTKHGGHSVCPDDQMALSWEAMSAYRNAGLAGVVMRGRDRPHPEDVEMPARQQARRSAHATQNLLAGHVLTPDDLIYKRPQLNGFSPRDETLLVGKTLFRGIKSGEQFRREHLTNE